MRPKNDSTILNEYWTVGRSPACPVFNTHAHFGPFGAIYFPEMGKENAMVTAMDRSGMEVAVISSHAALDHPASGNEVTARAVASYPVRFRGYLVVNPHYHEQAERDIAYFELWRERGFIGFKIHPSWHQYPLMGKNYQSMFEFANADRIPVLSHTWGKDQFCGSEQVRKLASSYPHVPFLAGHSIYGEWDEAVLIAQEHSSVYLELTAAYGVNGVIEHFVKGVGSERILFGDDLPWFDPMHGIGCVLSAHISDDDRHAILHRNAEALFGISLG